MITHVSLLELGFTELCERPHFYAYKVITGRLGTRTGSFEIEGFKVPINTISGLAYMLEIIDHYHR